MAFHFLNLWRFVLFILVIIVFENWKFFFRIRIEDKWICFEQIDDHEGAKKVGELFGYPLMIKSRRLAYDGRGNFVVKSEEELPSAVDGNWFFYLVYFCFLFSIKGKQGKTHLWIHTCPSLAKRKRKTSSCLFDMCTLFPFFYSSSLTPHSPHFAALGGFGRDLYAEKWAPFVQVNVYIFCCW